MKFFIDTAKVVKNTTINYAPFFIMVVAAAAVAAQENSDKTYSVFDLTICGLHNMTCVIEKIGESCEIVKKHCSNYNP